MENLLQMLFKLLDYLHLMDTFQFQYYNGVVLIKALLWARLMGSYIEA